ncbi:hypothetical protein PTW35_21755 (plasmid) [Photobacterium sp. DA100]|uniref:hypothetical protein n=1 Tax=Photobacterium sp. DA100 TaxID=3027472 RepID=UPI002479D8DB|nr:hypothetical protein [Photobacterium sp. DA100]WEM45700.1 hypothetical protein PTW35_21755 [Photobacterium sp. DA100]
MWRCCSPFDYFFKYVTPSCIVAILCLFPFATSGTEIKEEPYDIYYDRLYSDINDEDSFQDWIDDTQDTISDTVYDYSSSIDHFIAKKDEELPLTNRSYLRLKLKSRYTHREYFDTDASVKLKIDLPHTEKNWKFVLDTDPDDFDRLEDKQRGISNNSDSSLSGAVGGVQLQGQQWGKWRTNLDLGLKIKLPLDPFARADLRRIDRLSHKWTSRIKQEVFYYDSKGPGALTSLNFYFASPEDPSTILKISSSAQYLDTDDNWEFVQQAEIFDRINQDNLLQYSIGFSADSTPNYSITNSWVSVAWKHRLYSDWLYMSITPELDFQDAFQYKVNPGIMFELELFFTAEGGLDRLARKIPNPTN